MPAGLEETIASIHGWIWGWPLILLILFTGVYLSFRTHFIQVRCLGRALRYTIEQEPGCEGEVSAFGSLCTTLSATIGTGNIVGVAGAIALGGPGALLWMEIAALFGMATKYAEAMLAVRFREYAGEGRYFGGPFCYIEQGLGCRWRWLSKLFSIFGVLAGLLGIGTITQISGITAALESLLDPAQANVAFSLGNTAYTRTTVISGVVVALLAALVIVGGIKRISSVSQVIVPFMAISYVALILVIVLSNLSRIPSIIILVFHSAFTPEAALGAASGITLKTVMQKGIGRGIFSNEAGLGSAPIAAAAAKTNQPVRQGLVFMTATFIDTMVICTLTGLAVLLTDAWQQPGLEGIEITAYAWQQGLPFSPSFSTTMLILCLVFFAFTTIVGWEYYYESCAAYLTGGSRRAAALFRWLYIGAVLFGPYLSVSAVWNMAEICNGLMALPNLFALLMLGPMVEKDTTAYLRQYGKRR